MKIALVTLLLNEVEWLDLLWRQHRFWPGLVRWVFVESADVEYHRANPDMVASTGLSVDGTTEYLTWLAVERPDLVTYVPHGFSSGQSPERGKCEARQRYFDVLEDVRPDFVIMLDADEMYARQDQANINDWMAQAGSEWDSFLFRKREIWRPPSIAHEPVPRWEAVRGFWNIPCCHWWRWVPSMHHRNCHNTPTLPCGRPVNRRMLRLDDVPGAPQMLHMGFASTAKTRAAKNKYYADRGESADPKRSWHVESRQAWETWRPGDALPRGARVIPYDGPIPEVFI